MLKTSRFPCSKNMSQNNILLVIAHPKPVPKESFIFNSTNECSSDLTLVIYLFLKMCFSFAQNLNPSKNQCLIFSKCGPNQYKIWDFSTLMTWTQTVRFRRAQKMRIPFALVLFSETLNSLFYTERDWLFLLCYMNMDRLLIVYSHFFELKKGHFWFFNKAQLRMQCWHSYYKYETLVAYLCCIPPETAAHYSIALSLECT